MLNIIITGILALIAFIIGYENGKEMGWKEASDFTDETVKKANKIK